MGPRRSRSSSANLWGGTARFFVGAVRDLRVRRDGADPGRRVSATGPGLRPLAPSWASPGTREKGGRGAGY